MGVGAAAGSWDLSDEVIEEAEPRSEVKRLGDLTD